MYAGNKTKVSNHTSISFMKKYDSQLKRKKWITQSYLRQNGRLVCKINVYIVNI